MAEKMLSDLFYDTLKDIYFAERQILKALPKLAKTAKSPQLKEAFLSLTGTKRKRTSSAWTRFSRYLASAPRAKPAKQSRESLKRATK
jgi:ferritin-like metal-binding protein YciE